MTQLMRQIYTQYIYTPDPPIMLNIYDAAPAFSLWIALVFRPGIGDKECIPHIPCVPYLVTKRVIGWGSITPI